MKHPLHIDVGASKLTRGTIDYALTVWRKDGAYRDIGGLFYNH